jgi:hypothetical protein
MSDQGPSRPNGAEPPEAAKSLRDMAEEAYDEVLDANPEEPGEGPQVDDGARPRDAQGRFTAKQPAEETGEAAGEEPTQPRQEIPGQQPQQPTQPPQGASSEAPANWPAADREAFAKLAPEGQQFLLRRHSEMEGDYQRRVQATAAATQFTQSLGPIFNDPVIAASLRHNNLTAFDAIREWASMHRRASSPNVQDRYELWQEIGQRLGMDPAALGQSRSAQQPPNGLTEKELADPAIRYFADHVSRTVQDVQALRGQIIAMQNAAAEKANAEAMKVTRWGVDGFAEEKGQDGRLLRPDFDTVLPQIIELFEANPQRDLREAYEQARWLNPQTRQALIAAERTTATRQITDQRARQAVRGNVRGLTSPVSKPPSDPGRPRSLRDTLEETADEVGFGS